jgi:type I restriction enzyme R subunit
MIVAAHRTLLSVSTTHPMFSTRDFKAVPLKFRAVVPEYVKDYVSLNQFAA